MKVIESIRQHPYRSATAALLVGGIVVTESIGLVNNPTYAIPAESCVSPMAVSKTYVEPNASEFWRAHQTGIGSSGIVISGKEPAGVYGMQVSWKHAGAEDSAWEEGASALLKANELGNYAFKLGVGPGPVDFGIRTLAPEGSSTCAPDAKPPEVDFSPLLDAGAFYQADAELPYPHIFNVPSNIFGGPR